MLAQDQFVLLSRKGSKLDRPKRNVAID